MTPEAILSELMCCGIDPFVTPDGNGIVVPAGRLTEVQRTAVLNNKAALIDLILDSVRTTNELLEAAMRRCDEFNDGDKAREEMRRDVLQTPPHLRSDLLSHFKNRQRS